jgi:hypothetical protein
MPVLARQAFINDSGLMELFNVVDGIFNGVGKIAWLNAFRFFAC